MMVRMDDSVLDKIVADRRRTITAEKAALGAAQVERAGRTEIARQSLVAAMQKPGIQIIAEIKPARPGIGVLKEDISVSKLAEDYRNGGAAAISVLTEPRHFQGAWMNLRLAKEASGLPILCKDFIIDQFQLEMARTHGADAVLLIAASLFDFELNRLINAAHELGMEVLTEAINGEELRRVQASDTDLIGVNSRNLHTLEMDFDGALDLIGQLDDRRPVIMESGVYTRADAVKAEIAGANGILVGTALMKADDPAAKIRELRG
jgi:indole-3-glycerol phosphate synthase